MVIGNFEFSKQLIQKKLKPTFSYDGENYDKWKKEARQKLSDLLGMDKFDLCDSDMQVEFEEKHEGFTETRFTFQSEEGYRVPCHLWLPDGIENPPIVICLQGHSKGMHVSLGRPKFEGEEAVISGGDRDFAVQAIREGFAAVAMEQRNLGETSLGPGRISCKEGSMNALLMGRTAMAERVWDVSRLIDVLEKHFADKVDLDNLCCMGNSGGGTTTTYAAALEDRIKLAMPSCSNSTYKDSIGRIDHCTCNYIPNIGNVFEMSDLIAMSYPKCYIQVNGVSDNLFPIEGAKQVFADGKRVWEEHGEADKIEHVIGGEGHRFYADASWPVVHRMLGK